MVLTMQCAVILLSIFILAGCNLGQTVSPQATAEATPLSSEGLVVAWVDNGNLLVWQTGDTLPRRIASGGVVEPYIAPDGEHIAFTRGPQGNRDTLWVINVSGSGERQLVGERPTEYTPGENQVGDVVWMDGESLYFNTLIQQAPFYEPRNDLYRVNIRTQELSRLAAASEAGRIFLSPNGERLVTVYHGTYGRQDGVIRLFNLLERGEPEDMLFFAAVSTASEFRYYPPVHWLPDNNTILVAIPDPDLVYSDAATDDLPPTQLWQIPVDNPLARGMIGTVQASFFGLPRWSSDGSAMIYLQRIPESNRFRVYLAEGNGANPRTLYTADIQELEPPDWIPNSRNYVFARINDEGERSYFVGGVDTEPILLSDEAIFQLDFVTSQHYVYIAEGDGRLDLRFNQINGNSQFIGSLNTVPIFDALYLSN